MNYKLNPEAKYAVNVILFVAKSVAAVFILAAVFFLTLAFLNQAFDVSTEFGDTSEERICKKDYQNGRYDELVNDLTRDDFNVSRKEHADFYQAAEAYVIYVDTLKMKGVIESGVTIEGIDSKAEYEEGLASLESLADNAENGRNQDIIQGFIDELKQ